MSEREALDGRDRSGGQVEKGTPQYLIKLAEDALKAGDTEQAMELFRKACREWAGVWRVASGISRKNLANMSEEELNLLENDLMAQMPMTVSYFQRASENAKVLGKVESWEQALLIAQEAKLAWGLTETVCLRRLRGDP